MTIRSRVRAALVAGTTLLGVAGVVVVANFPPGPQNLGLDCRLPPGNVGEGRCSMLLDPPRAQCGALMSRGGEPPYPEQDAGFTNAQVRVGRMLNAMLDNSVAESTHCEADTVDGGPDCWCEVRGSLIRAADGKLDGQAPAWRDVIDAQGTGSIIVPGQVSLRPARYKRSGCRAHVFAGEDPCAGSAGLDGGPDVVDGGP